MGQEQFVVDQTKFRRALGWVVGLNLGYFLIEVLVAIMIASVSLFADSVDFLEDAAVNSLILLALGWPLHRRCQVGKLMAVIICVPALAALVMAVVKFVNPSPPDFASLVWTVGGAIVVNSICTLILAGFRRHRGSLTKAAFLAARNDVIANAAIIAMAFVTLATRSGWADIILGLFLVILNFGAAREVWQAANQEQLAARALAGVDLGQ